METEYEVSASSSLGPVGTIFMLAAIVIMVAASWKVFAKAGKPGWASLVPIYNIIVMLQIAGKPLWFIVLFFIPLANLIAMILVYLGIAKQFGKGGGFAAGLIFLPFLFFPILGFGSATYTPPATPSN